MQEIDLALSTLETILDEKVPFSEALRRRFQSDLAVRPLRKNVAALVGCELRHHLMFSYLLKDSVKDEKDARLLSLALANHYFFRRFQEEDVVKHLKENVSEENVNVYLEMVERIKRPEDLLPANMNHASNLYLSLRYNTPEWALKIFQHFGYGLTYKILRSYARQRQNIVRLVPGKISMEELCKDGDFAPNALFPEEMADHIGKTAMAKLASYRAGDIFGLKPFAHRVLKEHRVEAPGQILLYNGNENLGLEKDLLSIYGKNLGLNLAVPDTGARPEVTRMIRNSDLKNVNFFSAPNGDGFASAVSCKQDLVILAPKSTNFDDIPTTPDYLLRFDRESMDGLLKGEEELLENAAAQVEVGGTLIYMVFTISRKEGSKMIGEFLSRHEEFTKVEAKQHFPFEEDSCFSGVYYAEFRKEHEPLKIPTPLLVKQMGETRTRSYSAKQGEAA